MYIDRKFSSLSSSFFKPIVATSLLFLLPSLGMGDESAGNTYDVTGNGPKISVTTTENTRPKNLSWSNACTDKACTSSSTGTATWTESDGAWTGKFSSGGSDKNITNLVLRFDSDTNAIMTNKASSVYLYTGSSTYEAYINAYGTKASVITADFDGKSLGTEDNKINLDLRFASGLTGTKTITVSNLNTLNGDLTIGGAATGNTADVYQYDITLETLKGNIGIYGSNYLLKGSVTIKSAMVGSIYLTSNSSAGPDTSTNSTTAALTVNFVNGATMEGDIADRTNGYAGIRKDVYFKGGSGVVLTGNIVSFGTSSGSDVLNLSAGNRVYFTQGDMVGYIIASTGQYNNTSSSNNGSGSGGDASMKGLNVVVFGDSGTTTIHNLTGGILASDVNGRDASTDTSTKQAINVIVLADSTTLNINTDSKGGALDGSFAGGVIKGGDNGQSNNVFGYSVTSGSIVARNYGVNEIRIYKDSTLNLDSGNGSIKSVVNDTTSTTTNVNGSALNKINFLSENGVIKGSIVADNSKNGSGSNKASALNP